MSYDFTLDKKGVISVVASWLVMAALLFAAGLIVGSYWTSRESSVLAAKAAHLLILRPKTVVLIVADRMAHVEETVYKVDRLFSALNIKTHGEAGKKLQGKAAAANILHSGRSAGTRKRRLRSG